MHLYAKFFNIGIFVGFSSAENTVFGYRKIAKNDKKGSQVPQRNEVGSACSAVAFVNLD